jgi:transcriptional regulator with XRE-family HTH domain
MLIGMAGKTSGAAGHFGRQVRKERIARGWPLTEFAQRIDFDAGHLSRVENGRRPPTEKLAIACDRAFPERQGWFTEWYAEYSEWSEVPANFRDWGELEDRTTTFRVWTPGIIDGLLQTESYARVLVSVQPSATEEIIATRVGNRLERQKNVLGREKPSRFWLLVDELALYRQVGTVAVMAEQMNHLLSVAAMPNVTMQVVPAVAHPANASAFIVTDDASYAEHVVGGFAYVTEETVSRLGVLFDSLRAESYRASESAAMFRRAGELWATGVNPATQMATAVSA